MPYTDWGWLITPEELRSWILLEDERLLVINKPGSVVCHPSKHGPWSSLVGACREYTGAEVLHMPSRLDRETSGVVVLAKVREMGSLLQMAIQKGRVGKTYLAILEGAVDSELVVDQPIGRAEGSEVFLKQSVRSDGQTSVTRFVPLEQRGGYTLVRVHPESGRLHQIRVHAAWMGHAVAGDKLYGPDEHLFLRFIEHGFDEELQAALPLRRQALHACEMVFDIPGGPMRFEAPMPSDMSGFWSGLATA
jgi:23S rRNA pseudouridine1911/1915/1917 synthase